MRRIYNESEYYYPMHFFNEDGDILEQVLVDNPASTQTMLMKRKIFDKVTFDVSFKRFQDWDFMLQIVLNGFKVSYLPQPLVKSTVQTNSISGTAKTCEAYEHLFKKYKEYYEMYPNALANIYMQIARSYRGIDKEKVKRNLYLSFKNRKAPKTLIKILLSYVGLWA